MLSTQRKAALWTLYPLAAPLCGPQSSSSAPSIPRGAAHSRSHWLRPRRKSSRWRRCSTWRPWGSLSRARRWGAAGVGQSSASSRPSSDPQRDSGGGGGEGRFWGPPPGRGGRQGDREERGSPRPGPAMEVWLRGVGGGEQGRFGVPHPARRRWRHAWGRSRKPRWRPGHGCRCGGRRGTGNGPVMSRRGRGYSERLRPQPRWRLWRGRGFIEAPPPLLLPPPPRMGCLGTGPENGRFCPKNGPLPSAYG